MYAFYSTLCMLGFGLSPFSRHAAAARCRRESVVSLRRAVQMYGFENADKKIAPFFFTRGENCTRTVLGR